MSDKVQEIYDEVEKSLDKEIEALEKVLEGAVQAFRLDTAPKKLAKAAYEVAAFFESNYQAEGQVNVSFEDGKITEIVIIDTAILSDLNSVTEDQLEEQIRQALELDDARQKAVESRQVGTFDPENVQ